MSAVRSLRYEALGKFGEHSRSQSCSQLRLKQLLRIFQRVNDTTATYMFTFLQKHNRQKMTEMGLQYYFHNMNTGTTAEPTLPTASFSFHIKKSDDQSITLSHCQGFLSHNFFSPYYGVLSKEFLNSSLLETSECQNSRSINSACIYSTCNHLLFSFQSFHQSFCLCTKSKEKVSFTSDQDRVACFVSSKSHIRNNQLVKTQLLENIDNAQLKNTSTYNC